MSNNLKLIRKVKKLSQADVARKLNVAESTYSLYESGRRKISLEKAYRLSKLFGTTIEELFFAS